MSTLYEFWSYLGSRIRSLAYCCLLNRLSLTTGRRPRPSRNRSFRLARAVVFDVALCLLNLLNNTIETYIGLTENDFKTRYRNHTASFRHTRLRNSTELSKHIWTLHDSKIDHFISWRILSSSSPYYSASKRCNLCLKRKIPNHLPTLIVNA